MSIKQEDTVLVILAAMAFLIMIGVAATAHAATDPTEQIGRVSGTHCGEREVAERNLLEKYNETPRAMGLDAQGRLMELWASPDGGTWTLTVSDAHGKACLLGSGTLLEMVSPEPAGEDM